MGKRHNILMQAPIKKCELYAINYGFTKKLNEQITTPTSMYKEYEEDFNYFFTRNEQFVGKKPSEKNSFLLLHKNTGVQCSLVGVLGGAKKNEHTMPIEKTTCKSCAGKVNA